MNIDTKNNILVSKLNHTGLQRNKTNPIVSNHTFQNTYPSYIEYYPAFGGLGRRPASALLTLTAIANMLAPSAYAAQQQKPQVDDTIDSAYYETAPDDSSSSASLRDLAKAGRSAETESETDTPDDSSSSASLRDLAKAGRSAETESETDTPDDSSSSASLRDLARSSRSSDTDSSQSNASSDSQAPTTPPDGSKKDDEGEEPLTTGSGGEGGDGDNPPLKKAPSTTEPVVDPAAAAATDDPAALVPSLGEPPSDGDEFNPEAAVPVEAPPATSDSGATATVKGEETLPVAPDSDATTIIEGEETPLENPDNQDTNPVDAVTGAAPVTPLPIEDFIAPSEASLFTDDIKPASDLYYSGLRGAWNESEDVEAENASIDTLSVARGAYLEAKNSTLKALSDNTAMQEYLAFAADVQDREDVSAPAKIVMAEIARLDEESAALRKTKAETELSMLDTTISKGAKSGFVAGLEESRVMPGANTANIDVRVAEANKNIGASEGYMADLQSTLDTTNAQLAQNSGTTDDYIQTLRAAAAINVLTNNAIAEFQMRRNAAIDAQNEALAQTGNIQEAANVYAGALGSYTSYETSRTATGLDTFTEDNAYLNLKEPGKLDPDRNKPKWESFDISQWPLDDYELNLRDDFPTDEGKIIDNWTRNFDRYEAVEKETGVPAPLVAAIHYREAGEYIGNDKQYFGRYLHNGDKLGEPTVNEPAGVYFEDWSEAAVDALLHHAGGRKPYNVDFTSFSDMLDYAERYNGTGYRSRGLRSPYVWSGIEGMEQRGKYTGDGNFDANVLDQQLGVVAVLKIINDIGKDTSSALKTSSAPEATETLPDNSGGETIEDVTVTNPEANAVLPGTNIKMPVWRGSEVTALISKYKGYSEEEMARVLVDSGYRHDEDNWCADTATWAQGMIYGHDSTPGDLVNTCVHRTYPESVPGWCSTICIKDWADDLEERTGVNVFSTNVKDAKEGDIILFNSNGKWHHTGTFGKTQNGLLVTWEGNAGGTSGHRFVVRNKYNYWVDEDGDTWTQEYGTSKSERKVGFVLMHNLCTQPEA